MQDGRRGTLGRESGEIAATSQAPRGRTPVGEYAEVKLLPGALRRPRRDAFLACGRVKKQVEARVSNRTNQASRTSRPSWSSWSSRRGLVVVAGARQELQGRGRTGGRQAEECGLKQTAGLAGSKP